MKLSNYHGYLDNSPYSYLGIFFNTRKPAQNGPELFIEVKESIGISAYLTHMARKEFYLITSDGSIIAQLNWNRNIPPPVYSD